MTSREYPDLHLCKPVGLSPEAWDAARRLRNRPRDLVLRDLCHEIELGRGGPEETEFLRRVRLVVSRGSQDIP